MGKGEAMKFPWITLKNIQQAAAEAGCLTTQDREREMEIANELVLLAAMLDAKISAWADEIRRKNQCSICGGKHSCEEHL